LKKKLFVISLVFTVVSVKAQYKFDTIYGAKVITDKNGKLLSRYEPQTHGKGYVKASKFNIAVTEENIGRGDGSFLSEKYCQL
jgi:hypothetical protein